MQANRVLISLVTTDLPRSRAFVTNRNTPRFAWASPFGLHPASVLAGLAAGAGVAGFALRPSPLPIGSLASICIKGKGCAHVLTRSVLALRAAFRVRLPGVPLTPIPAITRSTATTGPGTKTRLVGRVGLVTASSWPDGHSVTKWRQNFTTWWRNQSPIPNKDLTYGNAKVA